MMRYFKSIPALLLAVAHFSCAKPPVQKPNILFLFADDLTFEALATSGNEIKTPHLDKLAENGVVFKNAYNMGGWHGAVCVASRTMLNTGRFLWNARQLEKKLPAMAASRSLWPQLLEKAGYSTYFSGKWHVQVSADSLFRVASHIRPGMPNQTPAGYNRPFKNQKDIWSPWDPKFNGFWKGGKHWSEVLADDAISFISDARTQTNPFFMYLAFNAPHDPRQAPKEYVERYPLDSIDVPENFMPEYPFKEEIGSGKNLRDEKLAPFPRTKYAVKVHRQEYFAIITHMDEQIGRVLAALEKSGMLDNTYIFFSADHGLSVGRHGLLGKQNMFEHSMKAPLIISGAAIPKGRQINAPVYVQDIMPSTLELAGAPVPEAVQFKSLLPLVDGRRQQQYSTIYGAYRHLQRMVRQDNFKLIYYPSIDKTLLFDLEKDPMEMQNLAESPEFRGKIDELHTELYRLERETGKNNTDALRH